MHPFPAEFDQQQAEALEVLRDAKAFILIHFPERECDNPFCEATHHHEATRVIACCSNRQLGESMEALGEEMALIASLNMLMGLSDKQRKQVADLIRSGDRSLFRVHEDDDED